MKYFFCLLAMKALTISAFANPYDNPSYLGFPFLANTATEMQYVTDPEGIPSEEVQQAFNDRAHGACRALGHNRARFALPNFMTYPAGQDRQKMILVDVLGFMQVKQIPYLHANSQRGDVFPTFFERLECF